MLILQNKLLVSAVLGFLTAQFLKVIINLIINKEFKLERIVGGGGMPSSHSATVVALAYSTGKTYGVTGFEFASAVIFAIIVIYDALNVRKETEKQSVILNLFLSSEYLEKVLKDVDKSKWAGIVLKEYVGHTPLQVLWGSLVGLAISYMVCL